MSFNRAYVSSLLGAAFAAGSAGASTITEGIGNFSNDWRSPTSIESGTAGISGSGAPTWKGGDRIDVFHFASLNPGTRSLDIDFFLTGPYPADRYANGGGSIYYSYVPFTGDYYVETDDGGVLESTELLAGNFDVTYDPWDLGDPGKRGTSNFAFEFGKEFSGDLFLALDFTYGEVGYNINTPASTETDGDSSLTPVPLPAAWWLLFASVSGLGLVASRRKRA